MLKSWKCENVGKVCHTTPCSVVSLFTFSHFHLFVLALLLALPASADTIPPTATSVDTFTTVIRQRIDVLLDDEIFERTQLGLYIYDITADVPLYDCGSRQSMRPASSMKVLTAATALAFLGSDYNYSTQLYLADSTHVALRGGMDPMIDHEDLMAFAQTLMAAGLDTIATDIICDASFKDSLTLGWGWCWDDEAVPLTPFLYQGKATFDQHFRQALQQAGITFTGHLVPGRVPANAVLLSTRTHTIRQILHPMLKRSNNLYAESLFYQLAALSRQPYASHKDAARQVNQFIDLCGHVISHHQVADGSGLSLYNYVTPALLVDALRYIYRQQDLYTIFYDALPIMGRDGTLKRRCVGTSAQDRIHAKTGTVEGVSSLAGYAIAPNGHHLAFAIINQGIRFTATGRNFQDRICKAITQPLDLPTIEPDTIPETAPEQSEITDSLYTEP